MAPGEYKVSVKYADKHIKGSPYAAKITGAHFVFIPVVEGDPVLTRCLVPGEGRKRNQISVGSNSEVPLPGRVSDQDIRALNASIQAPSGLEEPCFLKKLPNGNLGTLLDDESPESGHRSSAPFYVPHLTGISFTPREAGDHYVSIKRMGKHIPGSPFKIKVGEREVGDARKVTLTGKALQEGKTHMDNTFNIDTRKAGEL